MHISSDSSLSASGGGVPPLDFDVVRWHSFHPSSFCLLPSYFALILAHAITHVQQNYRLTIQERPPSRERGSFQLQLLFCEAQVVNSSKISGTPRTE